MGIEVSSEEVFSNLTKFSANLKNKSRKGKNLQEQRSYTVMLNQKTGGMSFDQKISITGTKNPIHLLKVEDLKVLRIIVTGDKAPLFETEDLGNLGLSDEAMRVAQETMDVLNLRSKEIKKNSSDELPEAIVLQNLSWVKMARRADLHQLPGWVGDISRKEAEKRLKSCEIGTYLIRKPDDLTLDGAAEQAVIDIGDHNHTSIDSFVITFVGFEEKISEYLILYTESGWMLFNDEPILKNSPKYDSFENLLKQLGPHVYKPIS